MRAESANARPALPAGYRLLAFETLASTNDEACRLARGGTAEGTVVWARRQTAGRGRRGRGWDSPAGNLYCSLILRPAAPAGIAAQLSFVAALALGDAVRALLPADVELRNKWPNDLLLGDRKVAGLLLESAGGREAVDWLVIGCGLNIDRFPEVTDNCPATSLGAAGVPRVEPYDMLRRFLIRFRSRHALWREAGFPPIRKAWLARAARLGTIINVRLADRSLRGRFSGLDDSGALILELGDGSREVISAGDVYL